MHKNITVGIPFYRKANPEYLRLAIDSIVNQSIKPVQIHLIQDGPVGDEINAVIQKYVSLDNVKLIKFEVNQGLAVALNASVKQADTTYYARMDGDDIAEPHRLQRQMEFLDEHPDTDIVGSWAVDIDENGNEIDTRRVPSNHIDIVKYIWTCPLIHPAVVFKRATLIAAGLYDESKYRNQDYELWFRCVQKGAIFANIPEVLLKYRLTEEWFDKNNSKILWQQVKVGWKGCWLIGAPPLAYIGSSFPLVKIVFPNWLVGKLSNTFKKIDPRDKVS